MHLQQLVDLLSDLVVDIVTDNLDPTEVEVSLQLETDAAREVFVSNEVEVSYDGDGCSSGCVLLGINAQKA